MQSATWRGFRHEQAVGAAATGDRSRSKGGFMGRGEPADVHSPNARQKFGEFSAPTLVARYSICHSRLRQKLSLRYQTDNALRTLATNRAGEPQRTRAARPRRRSAVDLRPIG